MAERVGADRRHWPHDHGAPPRPGRLPSMAAIAAALRCDAGSRVNRHVLLALAASTRPDGGARIEIAALAQITGLPVATAGRAVRELIAGGHVTLREATGCPPLFHIHPRGPNA